MLTPRNSEHSFLPNTAGPRFPSPSGFRLLMLRARVSRTAFHALHGPVFRRIECAMHLTLIDVQSAANACRKRQGSPRIFPL